jgi:DNA-binding transcriptional LysR family regulator
MKHLVTFRVIEAIAQTGSIRSAAERLSQTPSAVQRRLQNYEEELGFPIFERTAKGVRLNSAGELVIQHIRETLADTERLNSRIADLAGMRRGHVSVGCSQALVPYFLPREIAAYGALHPNVTFESVVIEHEQAAELLESYTVDVVLVFNEKSVPDYDVRLVVPQRLMAIMAVDHPLARYDVLRLRQCYAYPVALPVRGFGGRALLEQALYGKTFAAPPSMESNSFEFLKAHVAMTDAITFQIEIGAPDGTEGAGIVSRCIDPRDVVGGMLYVGQRRARTLPVAASRFVEKVSRTLADSYGPAARRSGPG